MQSLKGLTTNSTKHQDSPLKILLFCDASNFHHCLAEGLRRKGHKVVVASDGNRWMDTERDIDLGRIFDNKLGGALLWIKTLRLLQTSLAGFDIVSISNPTFPFLKPSRMQRVLKLLKKNNRHLFVNALGPDSFYVDSCLNNRSNLRYSEWFVEGKPTEFYLKNNREIQNWNDPPLKSLYYDLYCSSVGTTTILYEYDRIWKTFLEDESIGYTGIPIDTEAIKPLSLPDKPEKVKLFLGYKREHMLEKGTDRIMAAAKRVAEKYPDKCSLEIVENIPYKEYLDRMKNAHVVLDQLYSYTPATNALLAMAYGLNTLSGGEQEFYDFIGEQELRPVINAVPDDETLFAILVDVINHPERIKVRGLQGREFVERHHNLEFIADRYLEFWRRRIDKPLQKFKPEYDQSPS